MKWRVHNVFPGCNIIFSRPNNVMFDIFSTSLQCHLASWAIAQTRNVAKPPGISTHYTTIDPKRQRFDTGDSNPRPCALHQHSPKKWKPSRTQVHAHHHWPPIKLKDSNPRSCALHHHSPKSQRFEPKTMHYTTINHFSKPLPLGRKITWCPCVEVPVWRAWSCSWR
jgi:hypothetical protein